MAHYFTREEAEELLPALAQTLQALQVARAKIRSLEDELVTLQLQARGNGHHLHERTTKLQKSLLDEVNALRDVLREFQEYGCELKDPETGLVDFLCLHNGEEAYLCWRLGEARIAFWHPLDGGVAGRQPLE